MRVAGLDLARRSDHSALVLLDVEADRLTVTAALRLPQAPLRQQFALIAPHLAGLDLLVFDQSGLGDDAAELLPRTPTHVGVCLIGGDRPLTRSALVTGVQLVLFRTMAVSDRAPNREQLALRPSIVLEGDAGVVRKGVDARARTRPRGEHVTLPRGPHRGLLECRGS